MKKNLIARTARRFCWLMLLRFSLQCLSLCGIVVVVSLKTHTSFSCSRQASLQLRNAANRPAQSSCIWVSLVSSPPESLSTSWLIMFLLMTPWMQFFYSWLQKYLNYVSYFSCCSVLKTNKQRTSAKVNWTNRNITSHHFKTDCNDSKIS